MEIENIIPVLRALDFLAGKLRERSEYLPPALIELAQDIAEYLGE